VGDHFFVALADAELEEPSAIDFVIETSPCPIVALIEESRRIIAWAPV
jgi:hypothetical protein